MKNSRRRRSSSYANLWLTSKTERNAGHAYSDEEVQIEQLILKADLCENLESYVRTLSLGMHSILQSKSLTAAAQKNPKFKSKMKRIGLDIIEKCEEESDLYFVGVFASLKLSENWLDRKFYSLLANLIDQVIRRGLKISDILKHKIKLKLSKFMITHENREYLPYFTPSIKLTQ